MSMPVESIISDATLAESGFYWREHDGVRVLVCKALEASGFVNGFSTRLGGVSSFPSNDLNLAGFDEDTRENIEENRRRFMSAFGSDYRLATVWQVHGDAIKIVETEADIEMTDEKHDAVASNLDGVLVGVKTADCVPILIGDRATGAFAAVHAGWRGTAASIVSKAISKMGDVFGTDPKDLVSAIGPAATCRSYEIGREVIDAFAQNILNYQQYLSVTRNGHALIDLHSANRDQLTGAGVPESSISVAPFCTMERTDLFFSYRVEKKLYGRTGRLLSVVGKAAPRQWGSQTV